MPTEPPQPRTARPSLEAFQEALARKLADAVHRPATSGWLGVSWRGVRALVPLAQAGEIFHPTVLQRVPHTQPWVLGVASLRGGVTVVVDWVHFLGLPAQTAPADHDETVYWISFNAAIGAHAALCVDQLLGLRAAAELTPEPLSHAPVGVRQMCRDADGVQWVELDLVALAQSPAFLDPRLPEFARPVPPIVR